MSGGFGPFCKTVAGAVTYKAFNDAGSGNESQVENVGAKRDRPIRRSHRSSQNCLLASNSGSNRNAESFVLVSLDHQENPQHQANQSQQQPDHRPQTESNDSTKHPTGDRQPDSENRQATKDNNRLRRVKFNPRALIDQQEDDSRKPPKRVTEQSSNIFLKPLGRRSRSGYRCSNCTLACASLRTERSSPDFLTTRFTECHGVPPGFPNARERNKVLEVRQSNCSRGQVRSRGKNGLLFCGAFGTIRSNVELFVFGPQEHFRRYTTTCNGIFATSRHHRCRAPYIGRRRPWLDARRDGRDAFLARHRISVAGIFDGHSHGGFPEFVDTYRFRNRRTSVWFSCRPHWQNPCVNGVDSCVLDFKRGLRVHAHHSAAGLLSVCARTRDGRRVDDGGGADRGNLARRTSRQSAWV